MSQNDLALKAGIPTKLRSVIQNVALSVADLNTGVSRY